MFKNFLCRAFLYGYGKRLLFGFGFGFFCRSLLNPLLHLDKGLCLCGLFSGL